MTIFRLQNFPSLIEKHKVLNFLFCRQKLTTTTTTTLTTTSVAKRRRMWETWTLVVWSSHREQFNEWPCECFCVETVHHLLLLLLLWSKYRKKASEVLFPWTATSCWYCCCCWCSSQLFRNSFYFPEMKFYLCPDRREWERTKTELTKHRFIEAICCCCLSLFLFKRMPSLGLRHLETTLA